MQYVCRSCTLRLGQPWRIPANQRQWRQPLCRITWRMTSSTNLFDNESSTSMLGYAKNEGQDHSEADPIWTTNNHSSSDGFPGFPGGRGVEGPSVLLSKDMHMFSKASASSQKLDLKPESLSHDKAPQAMEEAEEDTAESEMYNFRKVSGRFRTLRLDSDWLYHREAPHTLQEDAEAVAVDEALDSNHQEDQKDLADQQKRSATHNHLSRKQVNRDHLRQAKATARRENHQLPLGPKAKAQLETLRYNCKKTQSNFAPVSKAFISWKMSFRELLNPEKGEPSPLEVRMLNRLLIFDSVDDMKSALETSLPGPKIKARNRILLCTALRRVPEKGAKVLEALFSGSALPFYMVEDYFSFLAYRIRAMNPDVRQDCAQRLADLIIHIFQRQGKKYMRPAQNSIFSILKALPPEKVEAWFQQLLTCGVPMHKYTLLQFASRFAKMAATKDLALEILRDLCEHEDLDINSPVGASLCTSMLVFGEDEDLDPLDQTIATPAELFQSLLDLGLVPNVITYTTIISNLCTKKDLRTALEVFNVMKQHGVQPDAYTYSVMINGCKYCGDFDGLVRFAAEARAANIHDPIVWNDVIHAIFLACLKETGLSQGHGRIRYIVWGPMKSIFTRFFDVEPLKGLISPLLNDVREFMESQGFSPRKIKVAFAELLPLPPKEVMQPTTSTLSLMIMGFIRHLPRPYHVVIFYYHFKELLSQGDPVARALVEEQGSMVHDIVLRALIKWKGMLRIMLNITGDMMNEASPAPTVPVPPPFSTTAPEPGDESPLNLNAQTEVCDAEKLPITNVEADSVDDLSELAGVEGGKDNEEENDPHVNTSAVGETSGTVMPPVRHPRPSVYTWSILLKAFMTNRLPREGEQIIKLMQHHGVKPNVVTWNTLAAEYARLRKPKNSVEAMRRLEAAGLKSDDWTLRAFSYIHDKAKAIRLMEQTVEQNRLAKEAIEEQQKQQQKAAERAARSGKPEAEQDEIERVRLRNPRTQEHERIEQQQKRQQKAAEGAARSRKPEAEQAGVERDRSPDPKAQEHEIEQEARQYPLEEDTRSQRAKARAVENATLDKPQAAHEPPLVPGKGSQSLHDSAQKTPGTPQRDYGAWDDFLWDQAGGAEAQEVEERKGPTI